MKMSQTLESTIRTTLIALLIAPLVGAAAAGQPARGAVDAACKPAIDAILKQISTPTHIYATETSTRHGCKPEPRESIYAGGAIYIQMKGQWRRSPMSVQDMRKQQEENVRNTKSMSCRYLRDETVNGETAAVYHSQGETEAGKSEATLWVSKRTGLPLRTVNDLDLGDKDKMHLEIRYEYAGVRPPAGVK
jgi:hypothetical protein